MLNEFIDSLKRDKARGELAPHQIILLLTFLDVYESNQSINFQINQLIETFDKIWKEHQDKYQTKNKSIGMPIKAFYNKGLIEIDFTDTISDFRRNKELVTKITNIKIGNEIEKNLKKENIKEFLVKRILF